MQIKMSHTATYITLHPVDPQIRLIRQVVDAVRNGEVIAYPTDSGYALGCKLGDKAPLERIIRIRHLDPRHNFTLMCRGMRDAGQYARLDTPVFRLIKSVTPGPYTFILKATNEVPKRLLHPKKRTIGIRIPDHAITVAILNELDAPLFSTSLVLPRHDESISDPEIIDREIGHEIGIVIDGGIMPFSPTSVIDFSSSEPEILREGQGDLTLFQ